jgi:hypothetical protein
MAILDGVNGLHNLSGISNFYYAAISTLSAFSAAYVASYLFASPSPERLQGLTHAIHRSAGVSKPGKL